MTTTTIPSEVVLASGRIVFVDHLGAGTLATCPWLVQVPSNNPEPDSPSDLWREVECGAPLFAVNGDLEAGWYCSGGHRHLAYGSPAQIAEERLEAEVEYLASQNPSIAARLDAGESWERVAYS